MKISLFKKVLLAAAAVLVIGGAVLGVHIYQVTKLKPMDPNAIALARIDFKGPISEEAASQCYTWFVAQPGVNRIQLNRQYQNAVLAYYPTRLNATNLIDSFIHVFKVDAARFQPSKAEMMKGCPVAFND